MTSCAQGEAPVAGLSARVTEATSRLASVDALRGLVMVIMLLDHLRETWFLYVPLSDPVDAQTVMPALFFTRITSTLCAPVFVALTGLGAYLYSAKHTLAETSSFLLKRGLFLVFLEFTLVNFSWRAEIPVQIIYLQVIWAIGLSMIVLAGLLHLPKRIVFAVGLAIVCGHNLMDGLVFPPAHPLHALGGLLHHRAEIEVLGVAVKLNYPVFPWIGVICLGWSIGGWFTSLEPDVRQRRLILLGAGMIAAFLLLRAINIYGDAPWFVVDGDPLRTVMSFLALTKYPPSLLFLLLTLGVGTILLSLLEKVQDAQVSHWLAVMGGAPMFFYIFHLYVLRALYLSAMAIWGPNHGPYFGVDSLGAVWLWYVALIPLLYFPTKWFSNFKRSRKDIWWLKYL